MVGKIKLYCYNICPFAQRAWIGLVKTGLPFEYVELNPYENRENAHWNAVNPRGLVPAITVDDKTPGLPESRVCLEFINELSGGKLLTTDALQNGFRRIAADQVDSKIIPAWYGFLTGKSSAEKMTTAWKDFCSNMDLSKGPFCYGEADIGFVDIMAAPFMIRAPVLETYKDYKVEELLEGDDQAKYKRWVQAVMNHPAVKPTLIDVDVIVKAYKKYSTGDLGNTKSDVLQKVKDSS